MKVEDLGQLSVKELRLLRERVDEAMVSVIAREKETLRAEMAALAAAHGVTLSELAGDVRPAQRQASVASGTVKYRNPSNPSETWSGRGRRPGWLTRAGGDIERFRI